MSSAAPADPTLGIFAKTFSGMSPHDVLAQAHNAGYATVQYNMACSGLPSLPSHIAPAVVTGIGDAMRATGVGIAALSATYNMIHPDVAARTAGLQSLAVLAGCAQSLEIPLLTLCSGSRNAENPWAAHAGNADATAWRDLRANLDAALAIAERYDVMLGIEPEPANVVADAVRARRLLDEVASARVGIVLDAANLVEPVLGEPDGVRRAVIEQAIDLLADRIVLVHAKDRRADGAVVPAGWGIVDFAAYFAALAAAHVHAPVITHGLDARDAAGVATTLRGALASAKSLR